MDVPPELLGRAGLISWFRRTLDNFFGSGEAALTVPPMDGALKPNRALDASSGSVAAEAPDNLVLHGEKLLFSSGGTVLSIEAVPGGRCTVPLHRFEGHVAAMAASAEALAVVLDAGEIVLLGGRHDRCRITRLGGAELRCPTAACFADPDHLLLCVGSATNTTDRWQQDLLERRASGSVWRIDLATGGAVRLADNLAYPYGILPVDDGRNIIVSESWRHRLVRLSATAPTQPQPVLSDLPGYPARLCGDGDGGAWLSVFAPRNQLVEFVMREPEYRTRMMRTLPPEYWIAPAMRSRKSFLEPLQGGGVRQMGMLKPWAPTRSYGLVIALGRDLQPRASLHSRADGSRHGVTSCLAHGDQLLIASKGGNEILIHDLEGSR